MKQSKPADTEHRDPLTDKRNATEDMGL